LKRSNRLILLIGVFLAIVAFVSVILISRPTETEGPPVPTELATVVAVVNIPLGTQITADMIREDTLPVENRLAGSFGATSEVIGRTVTREIVAEAQVTEADFSATITGPVSDLIPATYRSIAVQVDQVSGVGTLIKAGDRVDMVVGFTGDKFPVISVDPEAPEGTGITAVSGLNSTSVKLLLQGMQVIGTLLPPPTTVEGQPPAEGGEAPATLTGQQEIVLLSVTAQQAEIIKFAQMDGSISLILRSPDDFVDEAGQPIEPGSTETTGATLKVLVDEYGVLVPQLVETILPAVER
jgi:pilus assembly protein CpaB